MDDQNLDKLENNIRTQVHYEAEQTNRRFNWLGSLQGFLFAAFGLIYTSNVVTKHIVPEIICSLGFLIALLILIEIYGGVVSLIRLRKHFVKQGFDPNGRPDIFGYYPEKRPWMVFTAPEPLICFAIMFAWVGLFFVTWQS